MVSFEIFVTIQFTVFPKDNDHFGQKIIPHVEAFLTRHRDLAQAFDSITLIDFRYIKLGLNSCYLIRGIDVVMIDGGMPGKLGRFKRKLSKLGIQSSEIKLIVLTHSHFDHSGSAREIRDYTGARIALHESERTDVHSDFVPPYLPQTPDII